MTPEQSRPDGDHRGSTRMRLAAALLRRGQDLPTVAERTGVPVPLLELLLAEQQTPPRRPLPRLGHAAVTLRMTVTVLIVEFLAFCSLTVSITAMLERAPNVGVVSGALGVALIVAAWSLIRRSRPPHYQRRRPTFRRTRGRTNPAQRNEDHG